MDPALPRWVRPHLEPPRPGVLIVCSQRRWVADDMVNGADGRYPVRWDMGLDLPCAGPDLAAWWAPTEHAGRLLRAGAHLDLSAPGPSWLARVPAGLTGRPVWAGRLSDLAAAPRRGWAKPAEAKVPGLGAAWYESTDEFAAKARAAGFPTAGWVQVSPLRLELAEEHRCYVLAGAVLTSSPYLLAGGSSYEEGWEHRADLQHASARGFAQDVVDEMGEDQPSAYTLDVGRTVEGTWVVIEANPAWCSGTYGCELTAVADTVVESSASPPAALGSSRHGRFAWAPDPYVVSFAASRPLLQPWPRPGREP